jgi:hypothetical protein
LKKPPRSDSFAATVRRSGGQESRKDLKFMRVRGLLRRQDRIADRRLKFMRVRGRRLMIATASMIVLAIVVLELAPGFPGGPLLRLLPHRDLDLPRSTAAQRTPDCLRVLFIGNSFTAYNGGIPVALMKLASSARETRRLIVDRVTSDGATFRTQWAVGRAVERIREGNWDYVVLQAHSQATYRQKQEFFDYGRRFAAEIHAVGATPVLFMTWERLDQPRMQAVIARAYQTLGDEVGAPVVPVGLAWEETRNQRPGLILYLSDRKHPTVAGTYLTTCAFYAFFHDFGAKRLTASIEGASVLDFNLAPADLRFLQRIAARTVYTYGAQDPDGSSPPHAGPRAVTP